MRGREITAYLKSEKYTTAGRFKGNNSCTSLAEQEKKKKETRILGYFYVPTSITDFLLNIIQ